VDNELNELSPAQLHALYYFVRQLPGDCRDHFFANASENLRRRNRVHDRRWHAALVAAFDAHASSANPLLSKNI
jgi:hypothetical protein